MYNGYTFGVYFYLTWLPTYLQEGRGVTVSELGYYAALPWLAASICNLFGGWLTDRLGRNFRLRWARRGPAMAGLLASAFFLTIAATAKGNAIGISALALSFGAADLILAVCWATCLDIGRRHGGTVSGTMNSLGQLGGLVAPSVVGWLVDTYGSWELPLLIQAACYVAAAAFWLLIDAEKPLAAESDAAAA